MMCPKCGMDPTPALAHRRPEFCVKALVEEVGRLRRDLSEARQHLEEARREAAKRPEKGGRK